MSLPSLPVPPTVRAERERGGARREWSGGEQRRGEGRGKTKWEEERGGGRRWNSQITELGLERKLLITQIPVPDSRKKTTAYQTFGRFTDGQD